MVRRFIEIAAWVTVAFIVYATLVPLGMRPTVHDIDPDYERFAAYAVASALMALAYPKRWIRVGLVVIAMAVMLELLQLLVPDRDARLADAFVKIAGGIAGVAAAFFWNRWQIGQHVPAAEN
jgi:hypothetical protein